MGSCERSAAAGDAGLAVKCINGTYIGVKEGDVISHRGIPYVGEQPAGELRWKPPVPFEEDGGTYPAVEYGYVPCQVTSKDPTTAKGPQSEGCLYLNVFRNISDGNTSKPVMVFIHGGSFECGATSQSVYEGKYLVRDNPDVVLVTVEYRVGLFGFFHLSHLPDGEEYKEAGNLGILDQVMALRWIHENIRAFGGDPDNVTIFGESAGGCSVTVLAMIPQARQYFKRVIAQSGTPAFTRDVEEARAVADRVLEKTGCRTVAELKKLSAKQLLDATDPFNTWAERDGTLIPLDPYADYENGSTRDLEFMVGFDKDESRQFVCTMGVRTFEEFMGGRYDERQAAFPKEDREASEKILEEYREKYGHDHDFEQFYNQMDFINPAVRLADAHVAGGGRAYMYYWTQECVPEEELVRRGMEPGSLISFGDGGIPLLACHGVELCTVFNNREQMNAAQVFEESFSRQVQRMWINFAKCGDPSVPPSESPTGKAVAWDAYTPADPNVMVLDEKGTAESADVLDRVLDRQIYPFMKYYVK